MTTSTDSDTPTSWEIATGNIADISFESFKVCINTIFFSFSHSFPFQVAVILNDLADVRRKLGHFDSALELYSKRSNYYHIFF